jgi:hypothetical protein
MEIGRRRQRHLVAPRARRVLVAHNADHAADRHLAVGGERFEERAGPFDANKVQQAPLYTVEAHITRNLNRVFWISGDGFYTYGGATTVDGIDNRNPEVSLGLGGTLGVTVSGNFFLKFTYGQIVARNSNGLDGRAIRLVAATAF